MERWTGRTNGTVVVQPSRSSDELLRLLSESATDHAFCILDFAGRVIHWSPGAERLFGYEPGEIRGKHFFCLFAPEDLQDGAPVELSAADNSGGMPADRWYVRKDGSPFWGTGRISRLCDGDFLGYGVILRDMTAQKLAHDAICQSEKHLRKKLDQLQELCKHDDRFMVLLSHELGNSLSPLVRALSSIREDGSETYAPTEAPSDDAQHSKQLVQVMDELLETIGLAASKFRLVKEIAAAGNAENQGNGEYLDVPPAAQRVLVVDDYAAAADTLAQLLKLLGHEVRTAQSGEKSLEIAREFLPTVAMLDIELPDMDGYEVARCLREFETAQRPTIVAVSGFGRESDKRRAQLAGFDQHFTKPVDVRQLKTFFAGLPRASQANGELANPNQV